MTLCGFGCCRKGCGADNESARNTASEESAEGILANWCSWTGVSMTGWKDVVQAAA